MNGAHHVMFKDRVEAGDKLGSLLLAYQHTDTLVLGIARGGIIPASRIAERLSLPLDILVVKKIPHPSHPELALGALAPDSVRVIHWVHVQRAGIDEDYLRSMERVLKSEISRKMHMYRKRKKPIHVEGKTILLVDDGVATGATMEAAVLWARKKKAKQIIIAVPVASTDAVTLLKPDIHQSVCLVITDALGAVSEYYKSFSQISDAEVIKSLQG